MRIQNPRPVGFFGPGYPLVFLLLITLSSLPVFAGGQSEAPVYDKDVSVIDNQKVINRAEFTRPRRMIFFFDASPDNFSEFDRLMVYNSILTEIFDSNPEVVVLESPETTVPVTQDGRQQLARQIDADCWVLVRVSGTVDNVTYYQETYDMLTQQLYGVETRATGLRLDYRSLSRGFWQDLRKAIADNYSGLVDKLQVTLSALPGTTITGLTNQPAQIPDSGSAALALQNPATYSFKASLPGYYPEVMDFYLGYENLDINIRQKPAVTWGGEIGLNSIQFPSVQAYYFPVPGDVFVRLGFTTYALGVYLINDSLSFFRSNPLTAVHLHGGMYFGNQEALFRPYAALGGLLRIEHSDVRFGIDQLAPGGISLLGGAEYSFPGRSFRLYIEYNPLLYFTPDSAEFRKLSFPAPYIRDDNTVPGFLFLNGAVIDYRNFVLGVRLFF